MSPLDRYRRLASNTALFALSTFSSKVLVFLLMPLYTRALTTADFGGADLVVQTANLLIPLVSLGIAGAVVRFGLDKGYSEQGVFTVGVYAVGAGFFGFLILLPLLNLLPFLQGYLPVLYLYVLFACLRALFSQFVRARNLTRLYAFDGLYSTILTIVFNVLFLVVLKWGAKGYVLATVCADVGSCLFLFVTAGLARFFRPGKATRQLGSAMLRYSLPLIPSALFWWITNVSDRYMVTWMNGAAANGIYTIAYKIPTMLTLLSTIFTEAWQLSAMEQKDSRSRGAFFTKVFGALSGALFVGGAGIILLCRPLVALLAAPSYFAAWQFIPVLVLATIFAALANFLGSIYMLEKKSDRMLLTTLAGAVLNIGLNLLWIPKWGPQGAALATFLSYFLVFCLRAVNTRQYIPVRVQPFKMALALGLLGCSTLLLLWQVPQWPLWCAALAAGVGLLYFTPILNTLQRLLGRRGPTATEAEEG